MVAANHNLRRGRGEEGAGLALRHRFVALAALNLQRLSALQGGAAGTDPMSGPTKASDRAQQAVLAPGWGRPRAGVFGPHLGQPLVDGGEEFGGPRLSQRFPHCGFTLLTCEAAHRAASGGLGGLGWQNSPLRLSGGPNSGSPLQPAGVVPPRVRGGQARSSSTQLQPRVWMWIQGANGSSKPREWRWVPHTSTTSGTQRCVGRLCSLRCAHSEVRSRAGAVGRLRGRSQPKGAVQGGAARLPSPCLVPSAR